MNLLFVQTGFLGDVVLSTPVLTPLKQAFPGSRLTVMTTPAAAELVENHPAVDEVIPFDKRKSQRGISGFFRMRKLLRDKKFDIVFSAHKSWRTALLLAAARIPVRYGFREARGAFLYTGRASRAEYDHEVLRNFAVLKNIDLIPEPRAARLHVAVTPDARKKAAVIVDEMGRTQIIGLAPGSVWRTKRWTEQGFAEVGRRLIQRGFGVALIGGPADSGVCEQVEQAIGSGALNLCGKLSLLESAAIIERMALLVSNDSAPLHLASAMGTPAVAIFCATVPEFGYGPWGVPHEICGVETLHCRPCGRHGGNECPEGTHACRIGVTPDQVIGAIERLLAGSSDVVKLPLGRQ